MARVIDLKNRHIAEQEPKNDHTHARIISWSGLSHYHPDFKAMVFVVLILFAIAALVQIFQKNVITTALFTLLGVVILLNARRKPEVINFEVNPVGAVVDGKVFHYPEIKSFWIEYDPGLGISELSLQFKKWYTSYTKIPIYGQNPVRLRLVLLEFLPEVEHKDSIVEILSRKLGL